MRKLTAQEKAPLVRIRPQAYQIAKKLAKRKDIPMSILLSELVKERWIQDRIEDRSPHQRLRVN